MAYNFSQTYKQPLNEFELPEGNAITGIMGGLISGEAAGKMNKARNEENKRFKSDFEAMIGTQPTQSEIDMNLKSKGIKPGSFMTDWAGATLGARGVTKEAQNPLLKEEVQNRQLQNQRQQQENTLFDQLTRDAGGMVQEFSNLSTTEQRLNFLKNNAGKTLTREGAALMGQFAQITQQLATLENKSDAAIMAHKERQEKAELIEFGFDPRRPETLPKALKNRSSMKLHKMAHDMGVFIDGPIPDTLFDQDGILDYGAAESFLAKLRRDSTGPNSINSYEDPETGQRFVLKGNQLIKSGISMDAEEAKMILDAKIDSIQSQIRGLTTDPLRRTLPETQAKLRELESQQNSLIKEHYDTLRARRNKPAAPVEDQFQSTNSNPVAIKIAPNGKKALFDSVTKKFLRYAE